MAEVYWEQRGNRAFDVMIERETFLGNYDPAADIGKAFTAKAYKFTRTISDGNVGIEFVPKKDRAKVSGIEVVYKEGSGTEKPLVVSKASVSELESVSVKDEEEDLDIHIFEWN